MDLSIFDGEELLHLAIKLTAQQKYLDALACLKQAASLDPEDGKIAYFMGVVYAQIDLFERALAAMEKAVQLDPAMSTAHFQIGLLYMSSNRLAQAIDAWKPLDRLSDDDPLFLFKTGLEALSREDFEGCRRHLAEGIARNPQNPALNADMDRILQRIVAREAAPDTRLAS